VLNIVLFPLLPPSVEETLGGRSGEETAQHSETAKVETAKGDAETLGGRRGKSTITRKFLGLRLPVTQSYRKFENLNRLRLRATHVWHMHLSTQKVLAVSTLIL
jgi:hypothetical protein